MQRRNFAEKAQRLKQDRENNADRHQNGKHGTGGENEQNNPLKQIARAVVRRNFLVKVSNGGKTGCERNPRNVIRNEALTQSQNQKRRKQAHKRKQHAVIGGQGVKAG